MSSNLLQGQATPVRDADAICAKCHAGITSKYQKTPMANASGTAADHLVPGSFTHERSGTKYTIAKTGGTATLSYRDRGAEVDTAQRKLDYFLGSGHLGVTYLYSMDGYLFESPVAWYPGANGPGAQGYDMKPGLGEMTQTPQAIPMQSACLRCHMSAVQPSLEGTLNKYKDLPFLHTGITCEACHGETQGHVASRGKSPVVNPARLDAEKRDSICINCHLEGDVTVEHVGRKALDYKPGDAIADYLSFYVYAGENLSTRGVSEVEQLAASTCKRVSGDKMSCSSCHDPHFTPSAAERVEFYRGKCLSCHSESKIAALHHPENRDCTSCHMQKTGAENIPHVAWTDHRILRLPDAVKTRPSAIKSAKLVPIFSPKATPRDEAMAYYLALLDGNHSLAPKAMDLFKQLAPLAGDKEALDAEGILEIERGAADSAEQVFKEVLKLDGSDLTALTNLGTLEARKGKLDESMKLLQEAFKQNPDVPGLAMNLARVECAAGKGDAARDTLKTDLSFNPNLPSVTRLLSEMKNCAAATN